MSNRKEIDEIFEKSDSKNEDADITFTETKESLTKKPRQPRKPKVDIDFEKEKNDFLSSLLSKREDEPEKEVKQVKVVENKERKLQLIENLKKAREQKKLNKDKVKEQPKEVIKEQVKEVIKEDPEYLEWKRQRQAKQEQPKQEVKSEPVKVEPIKQQIIPQIIEQPKPEFITRCTFKKPLWAK